MDFQYISNMFLNCRVVKWEREVGSILALFVRRGATNLDCVPQRPLLHPAQVLQPCLSFLCFPEKKILPLLFRRLLKFPTFLLENEINRFRPLRAPERKSYIHLLAGEKICHMKSSKMSLIACIYYEFQ